jgi:ABC-type uncharacterized transport system fused permease/ATPase subunit
MTPRSTLQLRCKRTKSPLCFVSRELTPARTTQHGVGCITGSADGQGVALRLRDLSVTFDDETAVVNDTDVPILPGERVLVAGESGTGKSTI